MNAIKQTGTPLESVMRRRDQLSDEDHKTDGVEPDLNGFLIDVDLIDVPPQPRTSFNEGRIIAHINTLAESIRDQSQLNPIVVSKNPDKPGRFLLDAGECRYRAIRYNLGLKKIRATLAVTTPGDQKLNAMVRQLIDQNLREGFKPIEKAKWYLKLSEASGWSNRKLADQLHITEQMVGKYLSLLKAPQDVQDAIEKGSLAPSLWWNDKQSVLDSFDTCPYGTNVKKPPTKSKASKTVKSESTKISIDKDLALLILSVFKSLSPGLELESFESDLKSIKYALAINAEILSADTKEESEDDEITQD